MGTYLPGGRALAIVMALGMVGLGACGDPSASGRAIDTTNAPVAPAASSPTATAYPLPNTSMPSPPTGAAASVVVGPGRALEAGQHWCEPPRYEPSTQDDQTVLDEASVVERVLGIVDAYASSHADDVGSRWVTGIGSSSKAVVGFVRNVAQHRQELTALVDRPDRLVVCQARHTDAELAAANAEIQQRMTSGNDTTVFMSVGQGTTAVGVTLRADQQALADDLLAHYGDLVDITLGLFPYPKGSRAPDPTMAGACAPSGLDGPSSRDGLKVDAVLDAPTVRSGAELTGHVVLANVGTTPLRPATGSSLTGYVVRPGTTDVVGVSLMGSNAMLSTFDLAPGATAQVDLFAGTASCSPARYALAPGDYELLVPVSLPSHDGSAPATALVAGPVPLTVAT